MKTRSVLGEDRVLAAIASSPGFGVASAASKKILLIV